ncbi:MAG: RING finger domain-containing protein [Candidatus Thorarchaeota archaeon]
MNKVIEELGKSPLEDEVIFHSDTGKLGTEDYVVTNCRFLIKKEGFVHEFPVSEIEVSSFSSLKWWYLFVTWHNRKFEFVLRSEAAWEKIREAIGRAKLYYPQREIYSKSAIQQTLKEPFQLPVFSMQPRGNKETCPICRQPIHEVTRLFYCPACHQAFHIEHFAEWVRQKGRCPLCQEELFIK